MATGAVGATEDDSGYVTILTQRSTEVDDAGEILVFVGEQVSYEAKTIDCGKDCWVFDTWHKARYRVAQWIYGIQPGDEIEFDVAEHAPKIPFGHSRYALVFVERFAGDLQLVKYQHVPVYPTVDGSFGSCGPLWEGPYDPMKPAENIGPALRDLHFFPPLVVDDATRLSGFGRANAHDPRWHTTITDEVRCVRGVPLVELVASKVRADEVLSSGLPDLARVSR